MNNPNPPQPLPPRPLSSHLMIPNPGPVPNCFFLIHRVDNIPKYILCHGFTLYLAIQLPSRSYAFRADLSHFHRNICPPFSPAPAVSLMQRIHGGRPDLKKNAFRHYRGKIIDEARRGSRRIRSPTSCTPCGVPASTSLLSLDFFFHPQLTYFQNLPERK
jgi:hypothetical protein